MRTAGTPTRRHFVFRRSFVEGGNPWVPGRGGASDDAAWFTIVKGVGVRHDRGRGTKGIEATQSRTQRDKQIDAEMFAGCGVDPGWRKAFSMRDSTRPVAARVIEKAWEFTAMIFERNSVRDRPQADTSTGAVRRMRVWTTARGGRLFLLWPMLTAISRRCSG